MKPTKPEVRCFVCKSKDVSLAIEYDFVYCLKCWREAYEGNGNKAFWSLRHRVGSPAKIIQFSNNQDSHAAIIQYYYQKGIKDAAGDKTAAGVFTNTHKSLEILTVLLKKLIAVKEITLENLLDTEVTLESLQKIAKLIFAIEQEARTPNFEIKHYKTQKESSSSERENLSRKTAPQNRSSSPLISNAKVLKLFDQLDFENVTFDSIRSTPMSKGLAPSSSYYIKDSEESSSRGIDFRANRVVTNLR